MEFKCEWIAAYYKLKIVYSIIVSGMLPAFANCAGVEDMATKWPTESRTIWAVMEGETEAMGEGQVAVVVEGGREEVPSPGQEEARQAAQKHREK